MSFIIEKSIEHLKELEFLMRNEDAHFKEEDIENIDKVADFLQQLENQVKYVHDELEKETINASVLRHTLTYFPDQIRSEISEAVRAARDSNMHVINSQKERLSINSEQIVKLTARDAELSKSISVLQPEKVLAEKRHENIINLLNQRMSEKAECQIKLNETRDALRETNQNTADLEEDNLALKEQLIKDRAVAREEKIKIEEEKAETNMKARTQEELNDHKKKELDALEEKLKASEDVLRILFRENERLETSIENLENKISEGEKQHEVEKNHYNHLLREGLRMTSLEADTQQNYVVDKADIIGRTQKAGEDIVTRSELLKSLKEKQEANEESIKDIYKKYKSIQNEVLISSKFLDDVKDKIAAKLKEMAFIDSRNSTFYEELSKMEDAHGAIMEELNRELEEYRVQVQFERDNRMRKQKERDAKLAEIDLFQSGSQQDQVAAARYLSGKRAIFNELTEKHDELEQDLLKKDQIALTLTIELNNLTAKFENMKNKLETRANELETDINNLTESTGKLTEEIGIVSQPYQELVANFNATVQDYEETKRTVIITKSQKLSLENQIKVTGEKTSEHSKSTALLRKVIQEKRQDSLAKMKVRNEETKLLENEILNAGMRLTTLNSENMKFKQGIQEYENEIKTYGQRMDENKSQEIVLNSEYSKLKNEIEDGWEADRLIKILFEENDSELINKLSKIFQVTEAREIKLSNITERIYNELHNLAESLDVMGDLPDRSQTTTTNYDLLSSRSIITSAAVTIKSDSKMKKHNSSTLDALSLRARAGTNRTKK